LVFIIFISLSRDVSGRRPTYNPAKPACEFWPCGHLQRPAFLTRVKTDAPAYWAGASKPARPAIGLQSP
jgi:hypothetical protein